MYVLVNVPTTGGRRDCGVLREFTLEPANDLGHRASLILLAGRVFQLMLLAGLAALLRLDELILVSLIVHVVRVARLVDDVLLLLLIIVIRRRVQVYVVGD